MGDKEAGEKEGEGLQFRTAIPDLKLLPIHYAEEQPRSPTSPTGQSPRLYHSLTTPRDPAFWQKEGLIFKEDNKARIKAGSITSIISYFLSLDLDEGWVQKDLFSFLMVYRKFCAPEELWNAVKQNFFPQGQTIEPSALENQRKAVIKFLIKWINRCAAQDFFSSKKKFANPLWKNLHKFIKDLENENCIEYSRKLVETVQENNVRDDKRESIHQGDEDMEYVGLVWKITQTLWPRSLVPGEFKFLDLHPQEVAHAMTYTEYNLFINIKLTEFLEKSWVSDTANSLIYVMVNRFNHVAFWVATQIVSASSSERDAVLARFIEAAENCHQLNNFNTTMEILAGLSMGAISRLKDTWEALPQSALDTFKTLENLMKPMKNYLSYRERVRELRAQGIPLLPYLGIYLKDLTFVDENPSYVEGGLINFEKVELLGDIVTEIEHFQHQTFSLSSVETPIVNYLNALQVLNEDELWEMSKKCQ